MFEHDAWTKRRHSLVWKLRYRLGRRGYGPKKRNYHSNLSYKPSIKEFTEKLALKGMEGGMEAKPINYWEERWEANGYLPLPRRHDQNDIIRVNTDMQYIKAAISKSPKRRFAPE